MNMNKMGMVPIFCGLSAGAVVLFLLVIGRPDPQQPSPKQEKDSSLKKEGGKDLLSELQKENASLRDQIERLQASLNQMKSVSETETAKESESREEPVDLPTGFYRLAEKGLSFYQGPDYKNLLKAMKDLPEEARELLLERLAHAESAQERFFAAALLEDLGDEKSVPELGEAAMNDEDDLVRRMASHALARIGTDQARKPLEVCMNGDKDWGVRVNAAYGLAKMGGEEGLAMLKQSYLSKDTPAEYRLSILGGLADVADPTTAPLFREILSASKDVGYLLTAIGAVTKMKDKSSLLELRAILHSDHSSVIKEKAEEAIHTISN